MLLHSRSLAVLILISLFSCNHPLPESRLQQKHAALNTEVLTYAGIDSTLASLEKIPFEKLERKYLEYSGYNRELYRKGIEGKFFYKVTSRNSGRYLVGNFRVADFLPKDSLRLWSVADTSVVQYLCIDSTVLHRFLDLVNKLRAMGYNKYGFRIKDGFRYPNFNNRTGGARMSQHMFGRAIDIAIGDINGDGRFTESVDKAIIYSILDTSVIKGSGGLGRYTGTNVVHFDTRGYKARW